MELKCGCGKKFSNYIYYNGIVASEEREMGDEIVHVWNDSFSCPECKKELDVELTVWEYPEGMLNHADFSDSN